MVVFVNFAPLQFGGGAERWVIDVAGEVSKKEKVTLIDVHQSLADKYGQLVLKQKFSERIHEKLSTDSITHLSLDKEAFIPFSSSWKNARKIFKNARLVYIRYELLEVCIVLSVGGWSTLKKTVTGIQSPFRYRKPITFFDYLHNAVYSSSLSQRLLSHMQKVHVINPADEKLFMNKLELKNTVYVPNYIMPNEKQASKKIAVDDKLLHILFVGELNLRKGTDILIETIKNSPDTYMFHIAGDGPMRTEIEALQERKNVTYHQYLNKEQLSTLYDSGDILFSPSHAESFSLVWLEAMSHGLPIVSSFETDIGLPTKIQYINKSAKPDEYITLFEHFLEIKKKKDLQKYKKNIADYAELNFSRKVIMEQLMKKVLAVE